MESKLIMNENEKLEIYDRAINKFGIGMQTYKLVEELGELLDAVAKFKLGRCTYEQLNTELADVSIMVEQIARFYGYAGFIAEKNRKLERLNKLITENEI